MPTGNRAPKESGSSGRGSDPSRTVLVKATPDFALAHFHAVFVVIWRMRTTEDGAHLVRTECERFAQTRPDGIGLITIVEAGTPMPPAPARDAIAQFLRSGSSYIKASAVLFEGNSFRASAVRSVATGLTLIAKQAFPHKFFVDAGQANAFISQTLSHHLRAPSVDELSSALLRVRELIAESDRERVL